MVYRCKHSIRLCNVHYKVICKDFEYTTTTSLDIILNTPDDSDHGYYIVFDINYSNSCKVSPNKRKIHDNDLGYR